MHSFKQLKQVENFKGTCQHPLGARFWMLAGLVATPKVALCGILSDILCLQNMSPGFHAHTLLSVDTASPSCQKCLQLKWWLCKTEVSGSFSTLAIFAESWSEGAPNPLSVTHQVCANKTCTQRGQENRTLLGQAKTRSTPLKMAFLTSCC